MITINNISIRIYGGNAGLGLNKHPLVVVGDSPEGFEPVAPSLVGEQESWMITHAQGYTLYSAFSKKFHTVDNQPGIMMICLFFPPDKRLADGKSPLGLLSSIMERFIVQALRGGVLPQALVDNTPFKMLLGIYRLEERPMPLPIMQGQAPVAFCVESKAQLDALMRHSRYPVLSSVGHLELGFECKSTISLTTLGKRPQTNENVKAKEKAPEPKKESVGKNASNVSGGVFLDDAPIDTPSNSLFKRLLKVAAIVVGVVFGLFVLLVGIGLSIDDYDNGNDEKQLSVVDKDFPNVNLNDTMELTPVLSSREESKDDALEKKNDVKQEQREVVAENKAAELARAKEEKTKVEKEQARKREEDAKRQKEMENKAWQTKVQSYARQCPIQIRLGVRLTSISYTSSSVTYTVVYEELSKYNMMSDDKAEMVKDRANILKKYGADIPSNIHTYIVQKDKAGRNL